MEVFFNELSLAPSCASREEAVNKVIVLLNTMKALKDYDFNVLRAHDNFYAEEICTGYTFADFINDPAIKPDIKLLLRSIVKNPFITDVDSYEAEAYVVNGFTTPDVSGNHITPEGVAAAHIYSSPTISLAGHAHWEVDHIHLTVTNSAGQVSVEPVLNFYTVASTNSQAFKTWQQALSPVRPLNTAQNITAVFPEPPFSFDGKAIDDIVSWYYDDKRYLNRVKELLNDIIVNPFSGGKGHTEMLKGNNAGKASKRIIKKDRIIYTYTQQRITIHQCRGHYDDH